MNDILEMLIRRSRGTSPVPPAPTIPTDYDWYTPFSTDYTEVKNGITGVPTSSGICSIETDARFGGFLAMRKTSDANLTGLEFPNTQNLMAYGSGPFAISFWLNAPYWNTYGQAIISHRGDGTGYDRNNGFVIFKDSSNTMDLRCGGQSSQCKSFNVDTTGNWHHCLWMRDASGNWGWYEDGTMMTSGTGYTYNATNDITNVIVGGDGDWGKSAYFDLAQLRIYGRVLTAAEIEALKQEFTPAPDPDGLVFYAPLVDSAAATATTGQSLSYAGTVQNAQIDGISCLYLQSGNVRMTATGVVPTGNHAFTQSIWVRFPSLSKGALFAYGVNSTYGSIHLQSNNSSGKINGGGWFLDYELMSNAQTDRWYHFLQTYDGTKFDGYVDGTLVATANNTDVNVQDGGISIGVQPDGSMEQISELYVCAARLYDRVLTSAEITALANEF